MHVMRSLCPRLRGRRGSRAACVAALREALQQGACVAVDRCNFDEAQRADFVAAAREAGCAVRRLASVSASALCSKTVGPGARQMEVILPANRGLNRLHAQAS